MSNERQRRANERNVAARAACRQPNPGKGKWNSDRTMLGLHLTQEARAYLFWARVERGVMRTSKSVRVDRPKLPGSRA